MNNMNVVNERSGISASVSSCASAAPRPHRLWGWRRGH